MAERNQDKRGWADHNPQSQEATDFFELAMEVAVEDVQRACAEHRSCDLDSSPDESKSQSHGNRDSHTMGRDLSKIEASIQAALNEGESNGLKVAADLYAYYRLYSGRGELYTESVGQILDTLLKHEFDRTTSSDNQDCHYLIDEVIAESLYQLRQLPPAKDAASRSSIQELPAHESLDLSPSLPYKVGHNMAMAIQSRESSILPYSEASQSLTQTLSPVSVSVKPQKPLHLHSNDLPESAPSLLNLISKSLELSLLTANDAVTLDRFEMVQEGLLAR